MNREDITKMEAGREMDVLISERVLGEHIFSPHFLNQGICEICHKRGPAYGHFSPNYYSTDIAAAWEVVEKMCNGDKNKFMIYRYGFNNRGLPGKNPICWRVNFGHGNDNLLEYASAETASLAICRASLLTVVEAE
jgi:hypothetical protein